VSLKPGHAIKQKEQSMQFMRIGEAGAERPVVLLDGVARDISGLVHDIGPDTIQGLRDTLNGVDLAALPVVPTEGVRIGSPIARPRNVWCIGLNYSDHAAEAGMAVPSEPILFTKPGSTVCGPNDPILKSPAMTRLDWEVELGVVIGKPALELTSGNAMDAVFGYCAVNDVSERAWQLDRGGQWSKGKGYPNFCPTGPVLVAKEDLGDPGDLAMQLSVNGTVMQDGSTATMVFDVAHIVEYLSHFCLLEPGDLICTGTPPGVGMGQRPPVYLNDGDHVRLSVAGLGDQHNVVRATR
jgi:2-keto-4-pentenoate hydratase/2-oxohepta-3-ene-1,7-dioic acid hydratase in catechol pathway